MFRLKNKRLKLLWKITFWFGFGLFLSGLLMLVIGHTLSEKSIILASSNNIEIIDNSAVNFNRNLEISKIFGLLFFSIGGLTLAFTLIVPSFICYKECLYNDDFNDKLLPLNVKCLNDI